MNIVNALQDAASSSPPQMKQLSREFLNPLLEINVSRMDSNLLHLLGGFGDLDFAEFGLWNFNHISVKSSLAVSRVLSLRPPQFGNRR
jgi:hypothetical protein